MWMKCESFWCGSWALIVTQLHFTANTQVQTLFQCGLWFFVHCNESVSRCISSTWDCKWSPNVCDCIQLHIASEKLCNFLFGCEVRHECDCEFNGDAAPHKSWIHFIVITCVLLSTGTPKREPRNHMANMQINSNYIYINCAWIQRSNHFTRRKRRRKKKRNDELAIHSPMLWNMTSRCTKLTAEGWQRHSDSKEANQIKFTFHLTLSCAWVRYVFALQAIKWRSLQSSKFKCKFEFVSNSTLLMRKMKMSARTIKRNISVFMFLCSKCFCDGSILPEKCIQFGPRRGASRPVCVCVCEYAV